MSFGTYILVDDIPVLCSDSLTWGRWMEEHRRDCIVQKTQIGDTEISTVFLGLDHNHFGDGPPLLYETMIFGNPAFDQQQWRYPTRELALEDHFVIVTLVQSYLKSVQEE